VIAYAGDTTALALIERLRAAGIRQMLVRGRLNRRKPGMGYAYDNGAFEDWRHERPFNAEQFESDLLKMSELPASERPDFVALPDKVTEGMASLDFSLGWLRDLGARHSHLSYYLVLQDGMDYDAVSKRLDGVAGLFVGGTVRWKLATAHEWVRVAHDAGLPCHIGRVGSYKRVSWAKVIGADSIDSCLPLWSRAKERRFLSALRQGVLFEGNEPATNR
jgi:hypothetical protein